ncbi:hypothetical protein IMSAG185_01450 [Lachnospiraceae bacterium]|nr:hypothetical protein IMSAG185_01450 [Lachnospiraceae bacterium]
MADSGVMPHRLPHRRAAAFLFKLLHYFMVAVARKVQVEYPPDRFRLFLIDDVFRPHLVISKHVPGAVDHPVLEGDHLPRLHPHGGLFRFVLREGGHDGQPQLPVLIVHGPYAVLGEIHLNPHPLQEPRLLEGVHRVPCEPRYLPRDDQVEMAVFCVLHHPHEVFPLGYGGAGDPFIDIPAVQHPVRVSVYQVIVILHLVLQC